MENDNKPIDPAILEHIQAIQSLLKKQPGQSTTSPQVKKSDSVSFLLITFISNLNVYYYYLFVF